MSDTATHTRGTDSAVNPITGESPGIKEILERHAAEGPDTSPPEDRRQAEPAPRQEDDAEQAAREIASLRTERDGAVARAAEEFRLRQESDRQRVQALQGAEDTGFTAITTALGAATREKESLTAEMRTAGEAGDFGKIAEISARLGELGAEIRDLSQGKQQFEQDRQARLTRPTDRPVERSTEPAASSPSERGILQQLGAGSREAFLAGRTPATATWLRQHPEFFTDPSTNQKITGADALAKGRGITIDSPEYFRFIEENALGTTQQPRRDDARVPSAAPSRDVTGPTGRPRAANGDVYVSGEDKKLAEWMGVDPVEYVSERERLKSSGEWPYRRR